MRPVHAGQEAEKLDVVSSDIPQQSTHSGKLSYAVPTTRVEERGVTATVINKHNDPPRTESRKRHIGVQTDAPNSGSELKRRKIFARESLSSENDDDEGHLLTKLEVSGHLLSVSTANDISHTFV